jgi:hypothetical protein
MVQQPRFLRALVWFGGGLLALDGILASLYFGVNGFGTSSLKRWIIGLTCGWTICGIWWVMGKEKGGDKPAVSNDSSKGIGEGQTAKSDNGDVKQFAVDLAGAKIENLHLGSNAVADSPPRPVPSSVATPEIKLLNPVKCSVAWDEGMGRWLFQEGQEIALTIPIEHPMPILGGRGARIRRLSVHFKIANSAGYVLVPRAFWIGKSSNQIHLYAGTTCSVLIGIPRGEEWHTYQNSLTHEPSTNALIQGGGYRLPPKEIPLQKITPLAFILSVFSTSHAGEAEVLAIEHYKIVFEESTWYCVKNSV